MCMYVHTHHTTHMVIKHVQCVCYVGNHVCDSLMPLNE